jgi:hypothetical protein
MSKNIITVWQNKKKILEGIRNKVFTNDTVEEIAKERLTFCNSPCEHLDVEGKSCVIKATAPCCGLCGCSLELASRSLSYTCKAGKWPTYISDDDNVEISIILNYKKMLDELFESSEITKEKYNILLNSITSDKSITAIEARFEIRKLKGL